MKRIEITTQGRHVHFAEDGATLPRPLCGRSPDIMRRLYTDTGVCGGCLSVLTDNELTALPVLTLVGRDFALAHACELLFGPSSEPIPLADLVERSRKVPTA